jgi:hypothetical protein
MAAFLGSADHLIHFNPRGLHGARTSARDRQRENVAVILRATAVAGVLNEKETSLDLEAFLLKGNGIGPKGVCLWLLP